MEEEVVILIVVVFVLVMRVGDYQFVSGLCWEEDVLVRPFLLHFVDSLFFYHCALGNMLLLKGSFDLRLEVFVFSWSLSHWL